MAEFVVFYCGLIVTKSEFDEGIPRKSRHILKFYRYAVLNSRKSNVFV